MKVEQNSIVDLLAEPLKYQRHLETFNKLNSLQVEYVDRYVKRHPF